jgi:ATP-dependent RNA helicase RhlE
MSTLVDHQKGCLLMQFVDLHLSEPILRALAAQGYANATPIQAQAIPHVLEGRDVLGCAQTGTGKTAAFALPILHRLSADSPPAGSARRVRCLVLCPTRELASQIGNSFRTYGRELGLLYAVIFGGVNQNPQVQALKKGVDVLVATPGRLLDLMNQGHVKLDGVRTLVLDESDRMLDMGFINDIRKIAAKLPTNRQTLLFSATMAPEIQKLAESILRNPIRVQVAQVSSTADRIEESVYRVEKHNKPALLAHLVEHLPMSRAIVFTRTKHGADRVVRHLHGYGIRAEAIHGNKSQNARRRALASFSSNKIPVLVATDIASRGIDIDGVTHVVNYDLTHEPESYVHRIGRTARAGASGSAVSFCDHDEVANLKAIEKLLRRTIPVKTDGPTFAQRPMPAPAHPPTARSKPMPTHRPAKPPAHSKQNDHNGRQGKPRIGGGARPRKFASNSGRPGNQRRRSRDR